jgi:hypothetical protein
MRSGNQIIDLIAHRFANRAAALTIGIWLAVAAAIVVPSVGSVRAADPPPGPVTCELDNVGTLVEPSGFRRITLRCNLLGGADLNDRIVVIDRDQDADPSATDWRTIGDFDSDVWLFDRGGDGRFELAIAFGRDGASVRADLFDVPDGQSSVPFTLTEGRFVAPVGQPPTVRVVAAEGWWVRDKLINFNLDITVDGLVDAAFLMQHKYEGVFATDGIPDAVARIRDRNQNGRPEFDWRHLNLPDDVRQGNQQDFLMVNVRDDEPPLEPTFPWPYLGAVTYGYLTSSTLAVSRPPIQVDWETGKLTAVGEFVTSRGNDGQWFVYSYNQIVPGEESTTNFESPFAWYDWAGDRDRRPEGSIRVVYYPADDPNLLTGLFQTPYNLIRYSWDQDNDGSWDYKLGMLGKFPAETVVHFPEFDLNVLSYDELPAWVISRPWGPVFFVASEKTQTYGEGIYVWDPNGSGWGGIEAYFAGLRSALANEGASGPQPPPIDEGFRGDYNFALFDQPWLYVSPIDHELHLERATGGVWNIDGEREMRYLDLDGNGRFDGWQVWSSGAIVSQLYQIPGGLLYSDERQTLFQPAELPDVLLRTLPPTNHDEWQALNTQLGALRQEGDPGDLRAIFERFGGTTTTVALGPLASFRRDGGAAHFVLKASDEATRAALAALTGVRPERGPLVVSLANGRWATSPATFTAPSITIDVGETTALSSVPVRVTVANDATLDIDGASIRVTAVSANGAMIPVGLQEIAIAGGSRQTFDLSWAPPSPGTWRIEVTIIRTGVDARTGARLVLASFSQPVDARPPPPLAASTASRLGWTGSLPGRLAVALGFVLLVGVTAGRTLRTGRQTA